MWVRERIVLTSAAFGFTSVLSAHCVLPPRSVRVQHLWCSWKQESGTMSLSALHAQYASVSLTAGMCV